MIGKINYWLDLGILGEDVACVVEYNYQPRERMTAFYPGCSEGVLIEAVKIEGVTLSEKLHDQVVADLNGDDSLFDRISAKEYENIGEHLATLAEYRADYMEDR